MNLRQKFEVALLVIASILVYASYNPSDDTNAWISPLVLWIFFFFGVLMDFMFSDEMSFVFDPNPNNWRRKTDPHA